MNEWILSVLKHSSHTLKHWRPFKAVSKTKPNNTKTKYKHWHSLVLSKKVYFNYISEELKQQTNKPIHKPRTLAQEETHMSELNTEIPPLSPGEASWCHRKFTSLDIGRPWLKTQLGTDQLCDLRQVTFPLWASVSPSKFSLIQCGFLMSAHFITSSPKTA